LILRLTVRLAIVLSPLCPSAAWQAAAQTSTQAPDRPIENRAQQIIEEQAKKVPQLHPYEPTQAEQWIQKGETILLSNPPPVYPWFGSLYPGGLFAVGVGFRKPYGDTGLFDVHGGWSIKNYRGAQALFQLPQLAHRRVHVDLHASFLDAPSVAFYGLGTDTPSSGKASFSYRPTTLGAKVAITPVPQLAFGGGADYVAIETGAGSASTSINNRFNTISAPGLGEDPEYVRTQVFAGYDWRTSPRYTDHGGWYHAEWYDYRRRDDGPGDFRRLDAEVRQFFPVLRRNWVIALRGLVSTTDTDAGEQVPYFLMPDLGGADELRGYPAFRFRDRHRILTSAEFRWKAGQFVDMALFTDAGKVTATRGDLDLTGLKKSYGFGVRFHTPTATVLRVEVARTQSGYGLVFAAGQIF
jgi:hypothetical protein